nr:pyridoxal-phosphate dependent enzyme [Mycobacterium tuberculosis]
MNNNLPLANPVNPTSITSNPQILLANRAHRTLVRSRQTRDRYRLLPEGYQVTPGRNRHPGTMVGNTPVLWIPELSGTSDPDRGFWAKLEGFNPGGMKDRPALYMVECARARGDIAPGAAIVESTSGTLGLGLALAGKVYRHPVTLVTDPGLEPIIARMLTAYGAGVDMVTQPHPVGGWQQARKDRVAQLMAEYPGAWNPNQYGNPDNVGAYRSLALELVAQLGRIDVLVCSVGTGGHSAGVARVLREFNPDMRLIGVDTIGSTIFGQPASNRLMRGLGSSIYPRNVDYRAFDEVHWVAPPEAVWACRSLAATHYASGGWSVGAVALPQHRADSEREKTSILQDWRVVVRNRPFLTLAAAMTGCYALSFQIYLALPMQASIRMPRNQYLLIAAMFAVSGLVAVGGQLRITRWFAVRWGAERSLVVGATILAASFIPVAVIPNGQRFGVAVAVMALVLSASLLAVASAALFPFEMRAVVALSGDRLVATHYGFYSTIVGVGVLVGNLAIGSLMSAARRLNTDEIVWGGLILVGIVAVAGLRRLDTFTSGSQNMTGRWAAPR